MRDLTDEFKLSVRSVPEVFEALGIMVTRLAVARRVRFRGKKPTRAAVVNAALLYLDSLTPAEWERALAGGLARLEQILAMDDAPINDPTEGEVAPAAATRVGEVVAEDTPPPRPKPGRRKKES